MKKIKNLVATFSLMGIIIMTVSSANAGIIMADGATPGNTTIVKQLMDDIRNLVIGQMTGVSIKDTEGILFSDKSDDREGILFSD